MQKRTGRLLGRLFCFVVLAVTMARGGSAPATTQVRDILYRADGTPANGSLVIAWTDFVTADGHAVAAGNTTVALGSDGSFSVALAPNAGSTPSNSYYSVTVKLSGSTTSKEAWVVPAASPANLAAVRATVVPSTMAVQTLTSDWATANLVTLSGAQTIAGLKNFAVSPSTPDPVNGTDIANKEYVDANSVSGPDVAKVDVANNWTQNQNFSATNNANNMNALYNQPQTGFSIQQPMLITTDAFSGGINQYPQGYGTKTQFSGIYGKAYFRSRGERKWLTLYPNCYGKGDCVSYFGSQEDWGGFGTGGDEGSIAARLWARQGDGTNTDFPQGTVASVSGSQVTGAWATVSGTASNQWLGDDRPLINTSRNVYATGTIASVTGSGSPMVCTVTGSGTGWSALGTGAHADLFLNIPANDNGTMKWVVPVTSVTDDTHLVIEYNQNIYAASCPSASVTTSGGYNIYHGGVVASLVAPAGQATGANANATAVNLGAAATMFQAGDAIQEPVGYNLYIAGVKAVVAKTVGEPNAIGALAANQGPLTGMAAFEGDGNWTYGLWFTSSPASVIQVNGTSSGPQTLFNLCCDHSANQVQLLNVLNASSQLRSEGFSRTGDYFFFGGSYFSGDGARRSVGGSTPQNNVADWVYISAANAPTYTARWVNYYANPNNGVWLDHIDIGGVPLWGVVSAGGGSANTVVNNGGSLVFYAQNRSGMSASISGASGVAQFAAVQSGSSANSDMAGQIAIAGATSVAYTFAQHWNTAPICTVTPTSDPTAAGAYWVSTSATTLTITLKSQATLTFNYMCAGRT